MYVTDPFSIRIGDWSFSSKTILEYDAHNGFGESYSSFTSYLEPAFTRSEWDIQSVFDCAQTLIESV